MDKRILLATVFLCLCSCDTVHEEFSLISTVPFDKTKFKVDAPRVKCTKKPFNYTPSRQPSSVLEASVMEALAEQGGDILVNARLTDARNLVTAFRQRVSHYGGNAYIHCYVINTADSVKMYGVAKPAKAFDKPAPYTAPAKAHATTNVKVHVNVSSNAKATSN